MEWAHHHNVEAAGEDKSPQWLEDPKTQTNPGGWRAGRKSGEYFFKITDRRGEIHREEVAENLWNQTSRGTKVKAYRNRIWGFWMGLKEDGK